MKVKIFTGTAPKVEEEIQKLLDTGVKVIALSQSQYPPAGIAVTVVYEGVGR